MNHPTAPLPEQEQKVYEGTVQMDATFDTVLIVIPREAAERLGWKNGDKLSADETEISWDDFDGKGLVLSKQP